MATRSQSPSPSAPSRRDVLKSAAALGIASYILPGCAEPARKDLPNILFVLSDSHRSISTGCYGSRDVLTPGFDALATQGLLLETALSNTPLCRPYRASLMTGTFGNHNGMLTNTDPRNFSVDDRGQWNPGKLPLLAETFAAAGYTCGYVGKWHLGVVTTPPGPLRFGFNDYWRTSLYPSHTYWNWTYTRGRQDKVTGGGYFRPIMEANLAAEFIAEQAALPERKPWLMFLSWGPPHDPLEPPPEFSHDTEITLPENVRTIDSQIYARQTLPPYYGLIEAIDNEFGLLMEKLDALGVADDTIVIYTSDHGNMMGSKGLRGKEMPFRESSQVPFLIRWPGRIPAGSTLDMPFGAPDIFPTLCGLAGIDIPSGMDGQDYSRRFRGEDAGPYQEAAYLACNLSKLVEWPGWRGLRTSRYLYARKQVAPWMLFDLEVDPWELVSLVDSRPELTAEMDERLAGLMARYGDDWGA